jgi:hypothetical protein
MPNPGAYLVSDLPEGPNRVVARGVGGMDAISAPPLHARGGSMHDKNPEEPQSDSLRTTGTTKCRFFLKRICSLSSM